MRRRRQRGLARLPRESSRRAAGLAAVAVVGAGGIVALLRWRLWSSGVPDVNPAALTDWFDPDELARNRDYRRGVWTMAAIGAPLGAATAVGVALLGSRWRAAAGAGRAGAALARGGAVRRGTDRRHDRRRAAAVGRALRLGPRLRHRHPERARVDARPREGRSGIQVLISAGDRRRGGRGDRPRAARLVGAVAAGAAALIYALSVLSPLLLEPVFQKTEPLRDPALSAEVLELADRAGVEADDVKVNDASARTTAANAYVSGLGGSRHIVLFDTLLRDFPRDQVRMVVAHELAHVERRHVLKGSTWGAALAVPACLLVFAIVGWRTGFGAPGRGPGGHELVVRRLAVAAGVGRRHRAARAPRSAPGSAAPTSARPSGAAWRSRATPTPRSVCSRGWWSAASACPTRRTRCRVWFGTHPTALERIGMALRARDGGAELGRRAPRLQIAAVGRLRPPHDAPGRLYEERVNRMAGLRVDEVAAEPVQRGEDRARAREAERLRARLLPRAYRVALDPTGAAPASSEAFAAWLGAAHGRAAAGRLPARRGRRPRPAISSPRARSGSRWGRSRCPTSWPASCWPSSSTAR